jgi:hypothetical protein
MATFVLMGSLVGCAAPAREAASPVAAPAVEVAPAPVVAAPPPPAAPSAVANSFADMPRLQTVEEARLAVTASSREIEGAAGNCPTACRALGSMDRATGRLCALAVSSSDHRVCADAKAKLLNARGEVRARCVSCPEGVVVDPDAPCPSP